MENTSKEPSIEDIQEGFKKIQNSICNFLIQETNEHYQEDVWAYHKGEGGGITRVWEGDAEKSILEKAGVNYSGISGQNLPTAAAHLKVPPNSTFHACGVSLVLHPSNPNIPTIHMNVRYFQAENIWWFGGGIDLTPYYPRLSAVKKFHQTLRDVCSRHGHNYDTWKKECDEYFCIKHRDEMRGVGGIFFDQLTTNEKYSMSKQQLWDFIRDLGNTFIELYSPFIAKKYQLLPFTPEQRDFQLIRRSRYVEFNLVYDRGTKFGLQSEGRIESILMSLPALAKWKYNWKPKPGSKEEQVTKFCFTPQDWVNLDVQSTPLGPEEQD